MNSLVGYVSSDEDEVVDREPERPAKILKTDHRSSKPLSKDPADPGPSTTSNNIKSAAATPPTRAPQPAPAAESTLSSSPPASPYTLERQTIHNLTLPTHPNFSIPASPSPPPLNSEAALSLSTTEKKFTNFLALKSQSVHFNARLQTSISLRNPSLLPKLLAFAGVSEEESYASTLSSEAGGVPTVWREECYVETLVRDNERREKKRKGQRDGVDFVASKGSGVKSEASSAVGTPGSWNESGKKERTSRFDK